MSRQTNDDRLRGGPGISPAGGAVGLAEGPKPRDGLAAPVREFLSKLIQLQLVSAHAADVFLGGLKDQVAELTTPETLGSALINAGLLTQYLFDRAQSGNTYGLVLGNYRVLERLSGGTVSVVFLGEHIHMRRRVAIKVLPVDDDFDPSVLERFYTEMRVLAELRHPNIVMAYDAGQLPPPAPGMPVLHYLVMELVTGGDLENQVLDKGPASIAVGCDWIRQAASGMQEAHDHHLIHRDIKPSNMLLTAQGQVKMVDFGLARQFCSRLTEPKSLLGSIEFMAPEQSRDASGVGGTADIYGLGASLFWMLTRELPYPPQKNIAAALRALQQTPPRRLRSLLPEAPQELDDLIASMLEKDPTKRPQMPVTVMNALTRLAAPARTGWEQLVLEAGGNTAEAEAPDPAAAGVAGASGEGWRVLILADESHVDPGLGRGLEEFGCACLQTTQTVEILEVIRDENVDLVVVDIDDPDVNGESLCQQIEERPPRAHLKVVAVTNRSGPAGLTELLLIGVDDVATKPIDVRHMTVKLHQLLQLKDAQVRADLLTRHLLHANRQLEQSLDARANDVRHAQNAMLFALAKMIESKDGETPGHSRRLQQYVKILANALIKDPLSREKDALTEPFVDMLDRTIPLHDLGKVALPDTLLRKPEPLSADERSRMETHTVIGAVMLDEINQQFGDALPFLAVAGMVVRSHHERYDGTGYPDGLSGDSIPLPARLLAIADVYDALRRQRPHKPALSHEEAVKAIVAGSGTQFDPFLVRAFESCNGEFNRVYQDVRA